MHQLDDCIFCKIASGEAPAHKVFEDDQTLAFLDIFPSAPGHLLIITKEHFSDIFDATSEALSRVAEVSVRLAKAIEEVLDPDGLGVYQLNKSVAGQTVFHYHMHLIPRHAGDGGNIHSKTPGDQKELAKLAESLRKALNT